MDSTWDDVVNFLQRGMFEDAGVLVGQMLIEAGNMDFYDREVFIDALQEEIL